MSALVRTAVQMRITIIDQFNKNVDYKPCPYSTLQRRIFSRNKARRTRYIRRLKRFKLIIPPLPPACLSAIASNIYSSELSRLVDLAIVQAETRYELEFAGFAS